MGGTRSLGVRFAGIDIREEPSAGLAFEQQYAAVGPANALVRHGWPAAQGMRRIRLVPGRAPDAVAGGQVCQYTL